MKTHNLPRLVVALSSVLALMIGPSIQAQTSAPAATRTTTDDDQPTVRLDPFTVTTEQDKGYKANNAISGTRLNMPIKDIPMNLEVITEEFIRDTGSTNLRQALRYSSGVVLESQSDAFVEPDSDPMSAGVNDPRGATRRVGDSTTKMRGFVIDQVLRDGFRRQYSADAINIARVEVLRGPSALLYGVGSFGGVINYIPKRPEHEESFFGSVSTGSHGLFRAEFDYTAPLGSSDWRPAYRVTGAYQRRGDHTEWFNSEHFMVSPVFSFRPLPNTEIVIDNEFGYSNQVGVGFQNLRSNVNTGASRTASWLTDVSDGLIDNRTFRWSGPDTYLKGPFRNNAIDLTHRIGENLHFKIGAAQSEAGFKSRQIRDTGTANQPFVPSLPVNFSPTASVSIAGNTYNLRDALAQANAAPDQRFQGLTASQIFQIRPPGSFRGDLLYGLVVNSPVELQVQPGPPQTSDSAAVRYEWQDVDRTERRNQVRGDLHYDLNLGQLGRHSFIAGVQYMDLKSDEDFFAPGRSFANNPVSNIERYSYKNPGDYSPFRYGVQGDGRPDAPQLHIENRINRTWDLGYYGVYMGRFFDDRLTLIGGYRRDRNDRRLTTRYVYTGEATATTGRVSADAPTAESPQAGVSLAISRTLSAFALYSTGVVPNYSARDGNGDPFAPTKAKNYEAGVKFDLLDGKLSGTISAFKIERTNTPKFLWWAPAPYKNAEKGYNPSAPNAGVWQHWNPEALWYAIQQNGTAVAKSVLPSGYHDAIDAFATYAATPGNEHQPESSFYNQAVVSNWWSWDIDTTTGKRGFMAESQLNTEAGTTTDGLYFPLVNMSDPAVAAFAKSAKVDYRGWGGNWFYTTGQTYYFGDGTPGFGNAPDSSGADVGLDDEARGWDASFIYTPTKNLQIVANYANVKRRITSETYRFVSAPYWPLAWWYVRDGFFGTLSYNKSASEVYGDISDTTTYQALIPEHEQSADDTPKHRASLWVRYTLDDVLPVSGITVGAGGNWDSRRLWFTGFSGGGGNITTVEGADGERELVRLWTKSRYSVSAFAEYRTRISDRYAARFALNVDNLFNDQGRYGEIFAPGTTYRLTASVEF